MKKTLPLWTVLFSAYFLFLPPTSVGFTFPTVVDDVRDSMMPLFAGTLEIKPKSDFNCSTTPIKEYRFKLLTYPPRSTPSNSFLEVLDKVEKVVFEAESNAARSRPSKAKLDALTKNIKLALKERSFLFARETLGRALYMTLALGKRSGRVKRSSSNTGKIYLDKLKKELGDDKFGNLLGVKDEKTLIFAIDDTGSMGGEINAVKKITKEIVKTRGTNPPVDYILSVFNDPTTGPVIYKDDTKGKEFVKEVDKLRAHGGGDYAELTFKGMIAAMLQDPQEGSPMFVFTDATAKDATTKNKDELIKYATDMKVNINFITTSSAASFKPFIDVAKATCGMILKLHSSAEISKLTSVAKLMLNSFACASSGTVKPLLGKKRSATTSHVINIDDSVEKVLISVSTERPNPLIRLKNPHGRLTTSGKISIYHGAIYEVKNPDPGRWTLVVGTAAGKYDYIVRGLSSTNIDFDYYFVMVPTGGRRPVTISQPLAGQVAKAIISVTGIDKVQSSSLFIQVLDSTTGKVLKTATMKPRGRSKAHFLVSFQPPSTPFKLKIKGKTKARNTFERSSRKEIQATTALIRVHSAKDGQLTIPRGKRSYVIMMIYNTGPSERFSIVVTDPLGFAVSRKNRQIRVRKNKSRRFSIWFQANSSAKPGMADPAAVTIIGRRSGVKTGQVLNLIVV